MDKLLSVITVVKNGHKTIKRTIESVLSQKPEWCEYIIIDGASEDGTMDIINDSSDLIDRIVSEPDSGIYDAMNKGIRMAHGKYISFINSDDWYENDAIRNIEEYLRRGLDIVYGGVIQYKNGKPEGYIGSFGKSDPGLIYFTNLYCHQGMFIKRDLFRTVGLYDTTYKTYADYDWNIRAYEKNTLIECLDFVVANGDYGGASSESWYNCKEFSEIINKYSFNDQNRYKKAKETVETIFLNYKFRYLVKNYDCSINEIIDAESEIYIWGLGKNYNECKRFLSNKGIDIKGCIDSNKSIKSIQGIDVFTPSEIQKLLLESHVKKQYIVISTSKYENEIKDRIIKWGIKDLDMISFTDIKKKVVNCYPQIEWEKIG